jgi:surface antigen
MTMTISSRFIATALLGLLAAAPASAFNMMSVKDLPIRYMTDEDRALLQEAAKQALETAADGETRDWSNPKTGAHGELTPRASYKQDGVSCRDLEVANSARGRSNRLVLTLCRQDDGEWKIER